MNQDWNTHTESETRKRKMDNDATLDEVRVMGSWKRKKVGGDDLIFGENYANRFETTHGARSAFPPKGPIKDILLIDIDDDQVEAAKVVNINSLPYELTYSIDDHFIIVISNCCENTIQNLCLSHNVDINFGASQLQVSGRNKRDCDNALSAIKSMIKPLLNVAAVARNRFIPFEKLEPIQVKEKVIVPIDAMGLVAGKQFANVIRLQETYGVKVTVPSKDSGSNEILVEGLPERVTAAKFDILDNIPYILKRDIDPRFVGLIIGKKGEGLKRLSENYDIGIMFEDNKTAIITGKKENCEAALSEIYSIVEKQSKIVAANPFFERRQPEYVKEKVIVPMDIVGLVAGKKFANVIRLQETYGVKVTVPPKDSGSNEILVEGLVNQVAAAKVDILENSYVLERHIDTHFVGLIIGHKGEGLNRLVKNHNLLGMKFVDNKKVYITGRKDRCEAALSEIFSIMEKSMQSKANVTVVQRPFPNLGKYTWPFGGFH